MSVTPLPGGKTYGETITFEIEGLDEVQKRLNEFGQSTKLEVAKNMVTKAGDYIAEMMRQNVLTTFTKHPTGNLAASIRNTVTEGEEETYAEVGPDLDLAPYARIHEYGGIITPKPNGAKALSWIDDGTITGEANTRVFFKKVTIPARPYIEPALAMHQAEVVDIMNEEIDYAISSAAFDI